MSKTIFITGATKGFGRLWAESFLKRGDNVIASSRDVAGLQDLTGAYKENFLAVKLDITNRAEAIEVIQKADGHFAGGIDVLINNAGYGIIGAVEEYSEEEARAQFDANFFGTLWTTQAVIPLFRAKGKGHILQLSSSLGLNTIPIYGLYSATKFAVEAISESLQQEVKGFGINVTIVEPGPYSTEFASSIIQTKSNVVYDGIKTAVANNPGLSEEAHGVPDATVEAIFTLVDSENPPLHFFLGSGGLGWTKHNFSNKVAEWEEWEEISSKAQGK